MAKYTSSAQPDEKHHSKRLEGEKIKSSHAMMEDIKEVDQKVVANEIVREVDMSKDPEKKGEEWQ